MNSYAKTILTAIACLLLLFVPTYIAVANYVMAQNAPVDDSTISQLEITDTKGNFFLLDADKPSDMEIISGFVALNSQGVEQSSLPEPLVGQDYFEFKYYNYDRVSTYKYYFSPNPAEAYYVDHNNKAYHINEADAAAFLSTAYARCLYNTTDFPIMSVSNEKISPIEGSWAYQTYNGEYVELDNITYGSLTEKVYKMKGAFALNFDNQPDFLSVEISNAGTIVYNDLYENIANASLEGKTIDVVVNAKWYANDEESCYGEATYKFKAKILMPAVFYLGETTIDPGEFVVITAKNVDDPSAVTFTSEPDIGYTPKFFTDGDLVRALVPLNYNFVGEEVKMTLSYGEVTQEMLLDVNPKSFRQTSYDISPTIVSSTRTETNIKAFEDAMLPVIKETAPIPLWSGTFGQGLDQKLIDNLWAVLNAGYGIHRTILANGETYRHDGVDYTVASGTDVLAVNNGTVAYVGFLDYSGHTIVIDHGLGLKSFYCHLSAIDCQVGDTVAKGDLIGYTGQTGFTAKSSLHVGLSVFDVPVCPYDLWENGIIMSE